jgi:heme exporter protein B
MGRLQRISSIIRKELAVEFRQRSAIGGILLFAATVVYLVYKSYNEIDPRQWSILLWIIILFAGINGLIKSFTQEKKETYLYYYTLFDPIELVWAKLIYNIVLLSFICVWIVAFMTLFAGNPIKDMGLFVGSSLLGIIGISTVFTFISLIAAADSGSSTMMSVLALPLVLPILLLLLKLTALSARLMTDSSYDVDLLLLAAIDSIMIGGLLILFPAVWRS